MTRAERAKQFMPFASLRGYYDIVRESEKITIERRELSEGDQEELSQKLSAVKKGDVVALCVYTPYGYEWRRGKTRGVDGIGQSVEILGEKIPFSDIVDIRIEE